MGGKTRYGTMEDFIYYIAHRKHQMHKDLHAEKSPSTSNNAEQGIQRARYEELNDTICKLPAELQDRVEELMVIHRAK